METQTQRRRTFTPAPTKSDTYETSDLYLAAYLMARGFRLTDLTRGDRSQTVFVFDDREACLTEARNWNNEEDDEVQASVFSAEVKKLKGLAMRGHF